jgi:hypothetical protein
MKSDTFREEYIVKINRKGQGGFWVIGEIVEVEVTLYPVAEPKAPALKKKKTNEIPAEPLWSKT